MTRAYRTGAISVIEGKTLSEAWTKANDKGDKAYNDGRIENAKAKYGQIAVDLAMRIKSGEAPADIWATSTPEQQKYLMLDDKNNTVIPGVENIEEARGLWQDALDEVDRAKFSPGRQLANLLLPEALEKNKLIYSYTSGVADAAFRLGADPLVIGSKVVIGNEVHIQSFSHIESAVIKNNVSIGPYARIRPGTFLNDNSKVGNFVEIKNSKVDKFSKINHLSYIGDSDIGEKVNVGAGTITCNYDGAKKSKTKIKKNSFIGSNTSLVAPVTIGKNSIIGAGSVITKNVRDNKLALTRSEQKEMRYSRKNKKK